ncbi:MAG: hypothetical protein K6G30_14255, partial [Acetatifactor sp.]|nr:hypothetical protein [Acetatifactor sp.]
MKKIILKWSVFILTFFAALFISSKLLNKGHNNMTMDMSQATYPVITMECDGVPYNQLFGYRSPMNVAFQRDTYTILGENRNVAFSVNSYGRDIAELMIEVRSADGGRLIENTEVTDVHETAFGLAGEIVLKDLIDKDTEYSLAIVLTSEEEEIYYYTRVIWSDRLYLPEKISFVKDFHDRLYDREAARELTRYLETNSKLESNQSFHYVNIHSSFQQITWGDLDVTETVAPVIRLTGVTGQTATFLVDYVVSTGKGKSQVDYKTQEYFRVRYTTDRMYLLDYERVMNQIPQVEKMCVNDKLVLGIVDADVQMTESEDGNVVVFEQLGQLFSYNAVSNKIATIFSFLDSNHLDARTLNPEHEIKILNVDEGGNVWFAVYGYMSRGRHEGEVGIQVNLYNSELNTVEEAIYLPYDKTFAVLRTEANQLLYMNREDKLYVYLENELYSINLSERTVQSLVKVSQDDSIRVSENDKIVVWQEGADVYDCSHLNLQNLGNESNVMIQVDEDEAIRPLGFMNEDMIYGVAKKEDIRRYNSGDVFFPMYKIGITNSSG